MALPPCVQSGSNSAHDTSMESSMREELKSTHLKEISSILKPSVGRNSTDSSRALRSWTWACCPNTTCGCTCSTGLPEGRSIHTYIYTCRMENYMHMCTSIFAPTHVYPHMCTHTCVQPLLGPCLRTCTSVQAHVYTHICTSTFVHARVYSTSVHAHVYTHLCHGRCRTQPCEG